MCLLSSTPGAERPDPRNATQAVSTANRPTVVYDVGHACAERMVISQVAFMLAAFTRSRRNVRGTTRTADMTGRGRTAPTVRVRRPAAPRVLATGGKAVLVISVVVAGLWTATHGIAGVSWREVLSVLRDVRPRELALLALIWMGGLGIYARVLAAAMPGLAYDAAWCSTWAAAP